MKFTTVTISVYITSDYKINLGRHINTPFGLTYQRGVLVGTYIPYLDPSLEPCPPDT